MAEVLLWLDSLDEVAILRVAYTVAAAIGIPAALACLWIAIRGWRAIRRLGINGGVSRSARGYRRRGAYYVGVLVLIMVAGVLALSNNLPLRSVFGLVTLLTIAVWTTLMSWSDFADQIATVDPLAPQSESRAR